MSLSITISLICGLRGPHGGLGATSPCPIPQYPDVLIGLWANIALLKRSSKFLAKTRKRTCRRGRSCSHRENRAGRPPERSRQRLIRKFHRCSHSPSFGRGLVISPATGGCRELMFSRHESCRHPCDREHHRLGIFSICPDDKYPTSCAAAEDDHFRGQAGSRCRP